MKKVRQNKKAVLNTVEYSKMVRDAEQAMTLICAKDKEEYEDVHLEPSEEMPDGYKRSALGKAWALIDRNRRIAYSYHMLHQYTRRMIPKGLRTGLTDTGCLQRFLMRNEEMYYVCHEYEHESEVFSVDEGILTGTYENGMFLVKTFILNNRLTREQRDARFLARNGYMLEASRVYNAYCMADQRA